MWFEILSLGNYALKPDKDMFTIYNWTQYYVRTIFVTLSKM